MEERLAITATLTPASAQGVKDDLHKSVSGGVSEGLAMGAAMAGGPAGVAAAIAARAVGMADQTLSRSGFGDATVPLDMTGPNAIHSLARGIPLVGQAWERYMTPEFEAQKAGMPALASHFARLAMHGVKVDPAYMDEQAEFVRQYNVAESETYRSLMRRFGEKVKPFSMGSDFVEDAVKFGSFAARVGTAISGALDYMNPMNPQGLSASIAKMLSR